MEPYDGKRAVTAGETSPVGFATAKRGRQRVLATRPQIGQWPSWESDTRAILYQIITAGTFNSSENGCSNVEGSAPCALNGLED